VAEPTELLFNPAGALADLVRLGDVSARELADAALDRIAALDGDTGAFAIVDAEGARAAADAIGPGDERPFAGVPVAIKDLGTATAGLPVTNGSDLFGDYTPDYDSHVVRRLRSAGFVIVGKTVSPEMGIVPVTEPRRFGPARNPWNRERTPGGSSGGSGAAVAAGMVPLAHGSDGGGSIRIPAACCGLVGLKPSRGRISRGPDAGDSFLATDGMLTRTIADTAAVLDVLSGYEPGDATWAPPPYEPFAMTAAREPGRVRVGLMIEPALPAEVDPVAAQAARDTALLLERLGHDVQELEPPVRFDGLFETFTDLWAAMVSTGVLFGEMVAGRKASADDVEPLTWALHERALATPSSAYLRSLAIIQRVARAWIEWAARSRLDVVLTPALAQRPLRVGELDTCGPEPMKTFHRSADFTPFTSFANVTGQPAISLPMYHGDDGLPLAVQLIGMPLGEGLLLSLGAQLESEQRWPERRPPSA
jgi:amidase